MNDWDDYGYGKRDDDEDPLAFWRGLASALLLMAAVAVVALVVANYLGWP